MADQLEITVPDAEAMWRLGSLVGRCLEMQDFVALWGGLGAGKTTFSRGIVQQLQQGTQRIEEVPSPTFTLVQYYETAVCPVWHFDLYRIESPDEIYELGYEEALETGISLVEWPERMAELLPSTRLDVEIAIGPNSTDRLVAFRASGTWSERLVGLKRRILDL